MGNIRFIGKGFSLVTTTNWLGAVALRSKLNTGCDVVYVLLDVSRDMIAVPSVTSGLSVEITSIY